MDGPSNFRQACEARGIRFVVVTWVNAIEQGGPAVGVMLLR